MLTQNNYYQTTQAGFESKALAKTFMSNVFAWMGIALALTAFTAYYFASSPELISLLVKETGMTMLGWVVMLAPIGFVLAMSLGFQKFSVGTLTILFGIYAVLMGASLSFILLNLYFGFYFSNIRSNCRNVWNYGCCRIHYKNRPDKVRIHIDDGCYRYCNSQPGQYVYEKPDV